MPMSDPAHLSGRGPVAQLEERLRQLFGLPHALAVSSATTGLLAAGLALDLRGAEFVTTPYTWGGTLAGWLLLGNRPRFADIDPATLGLSPAAVRRAATPRCRAVLAVDIYGVPAPHASLARAARRLGAWYVVDAAQSLGARVEGSASGADADLVIVSFTHGKLVDAGEGGAVLTPHRDLYERLLWFTQHPIRQKLELGSVNEFAINGRIHPAAAECAVTAFDRALRSLPARRDAASRVLDAARATGLVAVPPHPRADEPSYYRLSASWRTAASPSRVEHLESALALAGCPLQVAPAPIQLLYHQPAFRAAYPLWARQVRCPAAERQQQRRFCLSGSVGGVHFS